jgi:hypothetical protein
MASSKLSALAAVTSTADESLIYVANTTDSGSSFAGKKITKANLLSGIATESYVTTQISNLVDGAPDALNTLNELAAAINDDATIATTLTALASANETHIDNVASLSGVAKDSVNLGTFTGSTVSDNLTVKAALQALETAVEAAGSATSLSAVVNDAADLRTLSGTADEAEDLGTFTGATIADSSTIKTALQSLETAVEAAGVVDAGDNVNRLVASTSAVTAPSTYYFLVVDQSDGSIKVVDKSFVEID